MNLNIRCMNIIRNLPGSTTNPGIHHESKSRFGISYVEFGRDGPLAAERQDEQTEHSICIVFMQNNQLVAKLTSFSDSFGVWCVCV